MPLYIFPCVTSHVVSLQFIFDDLREYHDTQEDQIRYHSGVTPHAPSLWYDSIDFRSRLAPEDFPLDQENA